MIVNFALPVLFIWRFFKKKQSQKHVSVISWGLVSAQLKDKTKQHWAPASVRITCSKRAKTRAYFWHKNYTTPPISCRHSILVCSTLIFDMSDVMACCEITRKKVGRNPLAFNEITTSPAWGRSAWTAAARKQSLYSFRSSECISRCDAEAENRGVDPRVWHLCKWTNVVKGQLEPIRF